MIRNPQEKLCNFFFNATHSHPAGRVLNSDWFVNSFIMVIYKNFFSKLQSKLFVQSRIKKFSWTKIKNYKTIYGLVKTERSSCRVVEHENVEIMKAIPLNTGCELDLNHDLGGVKKLIQNQSTLCYLYAIPTQNEKFRGKAFQSNCNIYSTYCLQSILIII